MIAVERGAARNTLDAYRRDLIDFSSFIIGQNATLDQVSNHIIEAYARDLATRGLSSSTTLRRRAALRQFFAFAHSEGWRSDDPTSRWDGVRKERSLPKTLQTSDVTPWSPRPALWADGAVRALYACWSLSMAVDCVSASLLDCQ